MKFHAKLLSVQYYCVLGSMKQVDLLKFMMRLDIQYYLVVGGKIKFAI